MSDILRRRAVLWLLLVGAFPQACSSANPTLYTLAPAPGTPRPGGPKTVTLRQIGLARYLERTQIVRSAENYQLDVRANEWWGEPLGSMIARVLTENLTQRLPGTSVYSENGVINQDPDAMGQMADTIAGMLADKSWPRDTAADPRTTVADRQM